MSDYTAQLRSLMQPAGLTSFQALCRAADVSKWQVSLLRQGRISDMRVAVLMQLSQALQVSIETLISMFSAEQFFDRGAASITPSDPPQIHADPEITEPKEVTELKQECQRLQTQLQQQRQQLNQEFQQASLQTLETWMMQFPTAAHAVAQNPELPASRLLPLMRPIEQLLQQWQIEMLAPVGTELSYDPQLHQLMSGVANPGDLVKVRYAGYRQAEKLLYRAKVSPLT